MMPPNAPTRAARLLSLLLALAAVLVGTACTAGQAADGAQTIRYVAPGAGAAAGPAGAVLGGMAAELADPIQHRFEEVAAQLKADHELAQAAHDVALAAGKPAAELPKVAAADAKMPWQDWVYGLLGIAVAGGTLYNRNRANQQQQSLGNLAGSVVEAIALHRKGASLDTIAKKLEDAGAPIDLRSTQVRALTSAARPVELVASQVGAAPS